MRSRRPLAVRRGGGRRGIASKSLAWCCHVWYLQAFVRMAWFRVEEVAVGSWVGIGCSMCFQLPGSSLQVAPGSCGLGSLGKSGRKPRALQDHARHHGRRTTSNSDPSPENLRRIGCRAGHVLPINILLRASTFPMCPPARRLSISRPTRVSIQIIDWSICVSRCVLRSAHVLCFACAVGRN